MRLVINMMKTEPVIWLMNSVLIYSGFSMAVEKKKKQQLHDQVQEEHCESFLDIVKAEWNLGQATIAVHV